MKKLILFSLLFISVKSLAVKTVLCGHFYTAYDPSLIMSYYASPIDFIEQSKTEYETLTDSSGNFYFIFDIDHPVSINLMNGSNYLFINKFINPGDSIWLGLHDHNIEFDGRGAKSLAAMFDYENKFLKGNELAKMQGSFPELQPLDFAKYWTCRMDSELAFFEEMLNATPARPQNKSAKEMMHLSTIIDSDNADKVPESYKNAVKNEMTYDAAVSLVQFAFRGRNGNRNIFSDTAYMRYVLSIPFNDDNALASGYYIHFLRELPFNFWQCRSDEKRFDSAIVKYNEANQFRLRDSVAKIYFKGVSYDVALYTILYEEVTCLNYYSGTSGFEKKYQDAVASVNKLGAGFNDSSYLARLKMKLAGFKLDESPAPDFTAYTLDGTPVKLSDFKGKVVYVDFWATSCGPCVAELPHILKLQEHFKDKDIVFLYVSFDHSKEILKQFIQEQKFTGTHLIDTKGFSSEAAMKYNIAGIPRHILVDKKGLLVSIDAPRPSAHPEKMIENALERK